jgi:hypothetical protein
MPSTVIARRSISTERRPRSVCSALLTPSREEPTQLASEFLLRDREVDPHTAARLLPAVLDGPLDEPRGDAPRSCPTAVTPADRGYPSIADNSPST